MFWSAADRRRRQLLPRFMSFSWVYASVRSNNDWWEGNEKFRKLTYTHHFKWICGTLKVIKNPEKRRRWVKVLDARVEVSSASESAWFCIRATSGSTIDSCRSTATSDDSKARLVKFRPCKTRYIRVIGFSLTDFRRLNWQARNCSTIPASVCLQLHNAACNWLQAICTGGSKVKTFQCRRSLCDSTRNV